MRDRVLIAVRHSDPYQCEAGGLDFHLAQYVGDGLSKRVAQPIVMSEPQSSMSTHDHEPAFSLDQESSQHLMDRLWALGIRPREIGTAGHLSATQAHLSDMRALVAGTLNVKLP